MPRIKPVLTAKEIASLSRQVGTHFVGGVTGLALKVSGDNAASWILRYRKKDYGLGGFDPKGLPLAEVRKKASEWRAMLDEGKDPRGEQRAEASTLFGDVFGKWLHERKYKREDTTEKSFQLMRKHAYPTLGGMDVKNISRAEVAAVLTPLFLNHKGTAERVYALLSQFFNWCVSADILPMSVRLPTDRALIGPLLPHRSQWSAVQHNPAIPWQEMPRFFEFMVQRGAHNTRGGLLLAFALLTNARRDNARLAKWEQFNEDLTLWEIPAEDMKQGKANGRHVVPLSKAARTVLLRARSIYGRGRFVFAHSSGNPLGDSCARNQLQALSEVDKLTGGTGFYDPETNKPPTPHGTARATFRTWALEREGASAEDERLAELCLHHKPKDKVEAAYLRGNALPKRAKLLDEWGDFCFSLSADKWGKIEE